MRPKERRETGQSDLLRSRLDAIIDMKHALAKPARTVDWGFLEERFGAVYEDTPGRPPLPTHLMAGLAILKHTYDLSDEVLCERLGGEPLLPVLLRRGVLPASLGVRPFVADALAPAHRGGEASGADPGEPVGGHPDHRAQAVRAGPSDRGHDGTAQERDVPDRRQASEPGARDPGAPGQEAWRGSAPVLCAGRQIRAHQASALCPRQAVQAGQQGAENAQDLSRPRRPRHRPQDRRRRGFADRLRAVDVAGPRRARAEAASARRQSLLAARARGGVHRQGQGPQALRVRRQGLGRHDAIAPQGGQFVTHVKAMPGKPYDGHTLATIIPEMEALIGNTIARLIADKGYRGHNAPPDYKFRVFISGQKRRMTPKIKREMRRRSAIEPVIGHLKAEHRMSRNYLAHRAGDAANAVLAAAGYNFRLLIRWLKLLLSQLLALPAGEPIVNPA